MSSGGEHGPCVIVGCGPRAVERRLIETLRPLVDEARRDPALLARPVLLIVASGTLRRHLARVLVRELGPTLLGLRIQTLWAVAREILERAGERAPADGGFFEVLARREAGKHDALVRDLGTLEDGYAAVAASARDLLSAGLDGASLPDALASIPAGAQREAAVLRAAAGTADAMRALGLGRPADMLRRAAARLVALDAPGPGGEPALPARALLVHGFADATGAAAELIRALLALPRATLYLDEPPDPARDDGSPDPGNTFRERFEARLALSGAARERIDNPAGATLDLFHAAGRDAEAREIAHRVVELLRPASGPAPEPEEIAVVVRSFDGWEVPFRRWFGLLGVPFSGGDEPARLRPRARRLDALLALIERGAEAPADAWLDAAGASLATGAESAHDLRLALRTLGLARLGDAERIDLAAVLGERRALPLPLLSALLGDVTGARGEGGDADVGDESGDESGDDDAASEEPDDRTDEEPAASVMKRRTVSAATLRTALDEARGLARRLAGRPLRAPLSEQLNGARALGGALLADAPSAGAAWTAALDALRDEGPPNEPLTREEFLLLLRPRVARASRRPLGGAGGGVQLLDVARARGLTFAHLFLAGVNRDLFPRLLHEDPLLPDAARHRLAAALPHLPQKSWGGDEERFLFAQLLAAAPAVTLSWQRADDDGEPLDPSPFVRRLLLERPGLAAVAVPRRRLALLDETVRRGRPLTAAEQLQRAALAGDLERVERLAPLAWDDAARRLPAAAGSGALDDLDRAVLAYARRQALEEWDAPPRGRGAGPLFGFLPARVAGYIAAGGDPPVTAVEQLARCAWRTYLERRLGLAPPPDPRAAFPEPDPRLVGAVVHQVLQRLVVDATGRRPDVLADLSDADPVAVARPDEALVASRAREIARQVALDEGITLAGLHEALAQRALPFLRRALALEWRAGALRVLGTEVNGVASFPGAGAPDGGAEAGAPIRLRFRADRADRRAADGALVLTDYKTGRSAVDGKKSETRRRNLRAKVAQGELLQGAVYASADGPGEKAGRYLLLHPAIEDHAVELVLESNDEAVRGDLTRAVTTLLAADRAGVFAPRLEDLRGKPKPNPACKRCPVRSACILDDSSPRGRWREVVRAALEQATAGQPVEPRLAALLAVLRLDAEPEP